MKTVISRFRMVLKCLNKSFGSFVFLFISTVISVFVLGLYEINDNTYLENNIIKSEKTYGDYHMVVSGCTEELKEKINNDVRIDKTFVVYEQKYISLDDDIYSYLYYDDDEILEFSEFKLLDGTYPKNENEILAEKSFLTGLGIQEKDMIGSTIKLPDPNNYTLTKLRVTGIINDMSNDWLPYISRNATFIRKYGGEISGAGIRLYSSFKNVKQINNIVEKYEAKEDEISIKGNEGVMASVSYYYSGSDDDTDKAIKTSLFIILLITVYNVVKLFIRKNIDVVNICKLLGIPVIYVSASLMFLITLVLMAGSIVGILSSIGVLKLVYHFTYEYYKILVSSVIIIPYKDLFFQFCVLIVSQIVVILFYMSGYVLKTPAEKIISASSGKRSVLRKITLYNDRHFKIAKKTVRNMSTSLFTKGGIVIIIAVMIISEMFSVIKLSKYVDFQDNNDNFEYMLELSIFGNVGKHVETLYKEICQICENDGVVMNEEWGGLKNVTLPREILDEEYIRKFAKERFYYENALDSLNYIDNVEMTIMGYNEAMLKKVCKDNKLDIELKDHEILLLSRTVNRDNDKSYPVNEVYQTLSMSTLNDDGMVDFKVVGYVDSVLVYPEVKGNYLYCIMPEKTYKEHFEAFEYPEYIYFNAEDKDTVEKIANVISGATGIYIYNQNGMAENINRDYYQTIATFVTIFILCILLVTINVILMHQFEFEVNKKNLAMEQVLGIGKSVQAKAALLESLIIYILGISLGILGMYIVNEKTGIFTSNASKIMDIKEILIIQIILYVVAAFIVMISSYVMNNKIKIPNDLDA